jgi:hypothetical protein
MVDIIELVRRAERARRRLRLSRHQIDLAILEGCGYRDLGGGRHCVQSGTMDGRLVEITYEQPARGEPGTALVVSIETRRGHRLFRWPRDR